MYQVGTVRRFYDGYQRKNTARHIALCNSSHSMLAIRTAFSFIGSPIFAIILGIIIGSLFTSWKREKRAPALDLRLKNPTMGRYPSRLWS